MIKVLASRYLRWRSDLSSQGPMVQPLKGGMRPARVASSVTLGVMTQLVEPDVHNVINYIHKVHENGYAPTVEEVIAFGQKPSRRIVKSGGAFSGFFEQLGQVSRDMFGKAEVEEFVEYLERLSWAKVESGRVRLTDLGRAVLRAADRSAEDDDAPVVQTSVISGSDQFAYARTLSIISELPNVMIVDPYIRIEQMIDLVTLPNVARVITAEEKGGVKSGPFAKILATSEHEMVVRFADRTDLHDRYLIAENGVVKQISTSLNSVGRRIGVITTLSEIAASAVAAEYEAIWDAASSASGGGNELTEGPGDSAA